MKKVKLINKKIPIFNYWFTLVIAETVIDGIMKTSLSKFVEMGEDDKIFYKEAGGVFLYQPLDNIKAIILPHSVTIDTVVHEVYHLVQNVKMCKGFEDEETEAYLMGYLTKFVTREMKKNFLKSGGDKKK